MLTTINDDARALYDGGWRADDREDLIKEYELTEDDADSLCDALKKLEDENRVWYAVMVSEDDDWGTGSYDLFEARKMRDNYLDAYPDAFIAVIQGDTCIDEIRD